MPLFVGTGCHLIGGYLFLLRRVFCGDLGNEVTDEVLANAFRKFKSFQKARVVRDKRTLKTKGYGEYVVRGTFWSQNVRRRLWNAGLCSSMWTSSGFVSFSDPADMLRALKEMNFKYVGNRPIRVLRSKWKDRCADTSARLLCAFVQGGDRWVEEFP